MAGNIGVIENALSPLADVSTIDNTSSIIRRPKKTMRRVSARRVDILLEILETDDRSKAKRIFELAMADKTNAEILQYAVDAWSRIAKIPPLTAVHRKSSASLKREIRALGRQLVKEIMPHERYRKPAIG